VAKILHPIVLKSGYSFTGTLLHHRTRLCQASLKDKTQVNKGTGKGREFVEVDYR